MNDQQKAEEKGRAKMRAANNKNGGKLRGSQHVKPTNSSSAQKETKTTTAIKKAQDSVDYAKRLFWINMVQGANLSQADQDEIARMKQQNQAYLARQSTATTTGGTEKKLTAKQLKEMEYQKKLDEMRARQRAELARPTTTESKSDSKDQKTKAVVAVDADIQSIRALNLAMQTALACFFQKRADRSRVSTWPKMARVSEATGTKIGLPDAPCVSKFVTETKSVYDTKDRRACMISSVDRAMDRLRDEDHKVELGSDDRKTIQALIKQAAISHPTRADMACVCHMLMEMFIAGALLKDQNENYRLAAGQALVMYMELESRLFEVDGVLG